MDSERLDFVLSSTVYEENISSIVVEIFPSMALTPKNIAVKYHWFRQLVGKKFVIQKIKYEIQKGEVSAKVCRVIFCQN